MRGPDLGSAAFLAELVALAVGIYGIASTGVVDRARNVL
jgi:hypothetical protein